MLGKIPNHFLFPTDVWGAGDARGLGTGAGAGSGHHGAGERALQSLHTSETPGMSRSHVTLSSSETQQRYDDRWRKSLADTSHSLIPFYRKRRTNIHLALVMEDTLLSGISGLVCSTSTMNIMFTTSNQMSIWEEIVSPAIFTIYNSCCGDPLTFADTFHDP